MLTMYWWMVFVLCMVMPVVLTIGGALMLRRCPQMDARFLGYRSKRSMKNEETWQYANAYCGKLYLLIGCLLFLSFIPLTPFYHGTVLTLTLIGAGILIAQAALMVLCTLLTERALKRKYPDKSKRD